ncbi:class I SAM-dependent methyltransferase [Janibacter limosus]|uniref:class I SAM-dependent methyltransferase n=1 Tax=Janibacter limosus TaxID=53458 RepID=UPI0013EE703D|nr:class I SAM-dependent methyltransferase [Janibacter limosus]
MTASMHDTDRGWDLVRLAEATPKALDGRVRSELERGRRDYQPLRSEVIDPADRAVPESPNNRARLERLADYVLDGDAIVEIGCGRGFVGGQLLAAGAGHYSAMDIVADYARSARAVLESLGHGDRLGHIRQQDLYTLTPRDLVDADLVVCSEVIEHVPDPEAALEAIGGALPEGGELLFTVPLLGKLEKVWGHLSIFTAERLQSMLERAGLTAHHVEPLVGQWVLVLAGPAGVPTQRQDERLTQLRVRAADHPEVALPADLTPVPTQPTRFDNVATRTLEVSAVGDAPPTAGVRVTPPDDADQTVRVAVEAGAVGDEVTGGVGISLAGAGPVEGARLSFEVEDVTHVRQVTVTFRRPDASPAGEWRWRPSDQDRARVAVAHTASLRPGAHRPPFSGPRRAQVPEADRVEVTATVAAGGTARLRIVRWGWIR